MIGLGSETTGNTEQKVIWVLAFDLVEALMIRNVSTAHSQCAWANVHGLWRGAACTVAFQANQIGSQQVERT